MRSLYSTNTHTISWHILIIYNLSVYEQKTITLFPVRRANLINWESNLFNCSESNYHTSFQIYHLSSLHELSQSHSQWEFLEYYILDPSGQTAVVFPCNDLLRRREPLQE